MARKLEGIVVSDKMQSTAVVSVTHMRKHAKYQKYYKVTSRFKAQNDNNQYKTGDVVIIEETRPLSKEKRFRIVSLVKQAGNVEDVRNARNEKTKES